MLIRYPLDFWQLERMHNRLDNQRLANALVVQAVEPFLDLDAVVHGAIDLINNHDAGERVVLILVALVLIQAVGLAQQRVRVVLLL